MTDIKQLISELDLQKNISLDDIPNLDLYMDQVIQLFENTYKTTKRSEKDKILTKTMINNYAKDKLLPPIQNKKYTREHIIFISLIYQLKGALSINDIKAILTSIHENEAINIEQLYKKYLELIADQSRGFVEDLEKRQLAIEATVENVSPDSQESAETLLLIASFVHMSSLYRRMAEKLVDQLEL
ncbi:DUF1836 domain-containing protein [Bacillus sp. HMF5848]|uniref:DUF1836 domain-containing protein n=1 Tax=Bacillus sp. HMF5848 TaxID=2495421 RepID=UPI000F773B00|nr:DUF1836 domain-containing protein [Bacillus sp. HMF5848]RSK29075.1 DUF1836 domain-containing protein [Bacillus sp. HMF5848]